MKKIFAFLLFVLLCSNSFALIGNTNDSTTSDIITTTINAGRYVAASNMVVSNMFAKVTGSGGKYKLALYNGDSSTPSTFIMGTAEETCPTNGWYRFPLPSAVSLTGGQTYWIAVWSDNNNSKVYYINGGALRWIQQTPYSATWPSPLNTVAGAAFNYCMYADDFAGTPPVTNPPPVITTTNTFPLTLAWTLPPNPNVVGVYVYYGVASRTYTNKSDAGFTTNYTLNLPKIVGLTYWFSATSYNSLGLESGYTTNEPTYTVPATNALTPPVIRITLP